MIRELIDQITQSKNELFSIDPNDSDFKDIYLRFQKYYSDLKKARKQIADSNVSADELNNVLTESKDLIFKIERLDTGIIGDTFTIE